MSDQRPMLLAGEWIETADTFEVNDPYRQSELATVSTATDTDVEASIEAATGSAKEMRTLGRFEIAEGLRKISAEIVARREELARSIAEESAKPMLYARGEADRAVATFAFAAGEAERFVGEIVPMDAQAKGKGRWARTELVPRGVIYGITPFNFPLNLVAHKVAPALAAGNSIIIKPSPRTPLTALLLGEIFLNSGLPKAALQVVPAEVGFVDRYLEDDRVSMLSFTGSARVGWDLKARAAKKAVALELGGNAPVIIDRAVDTTRSVKACVTGAFAYSGQVCISVQRIYVHNERYEEWTEAFLGETRRLVNGDPLDDGTNFAVMIDEAAAARAKSWIDEAVAGGAQLLCGGGQQASFLEATVLTNTDPEMRVVSEEVFAPIVCIERFDEIADAIAMANNSKYGLQAGMFSNDAAAIQYACDNLEYGGVMINDGPIFRVDNMPYGGVKDSGFGREGVRYAMEEMSERKLIVYA